jgi:hypothetical protein
MLSGPTETHVQSSQVNYSSQGSKINLTKKFDDGKSLSSLDQGEKRWQQQPPAPKEGGDPYIKISFRQKKARNQIPGSTRTRSQRTYAKKSSAQPALASVGPFQDHQPLPEATGPAPSSKPHAIGKLKFIINQINNGKHNSSFQMSNYNDFQVVGTKHEQPISQKQFIDKFTNLPEAFPFNFQRDKEMFSNIRARGNTVLISEEETTSGMRIIEEDECSPTASPCNNFSIRSGLRTPSKKVVFQ